MINFKKLRENFVRQDLSFQYFTSITTCAQESRPERSVAGFGASLTLLASCKVLLNLSAIRHFDDP